MHINTKVLKSTTNPKIASTVSKLATARSNLTGLAMPDNFSQASQLNNIQNRISQVEKNISGIISYVNTKIGEFEEAESKATKATNDLARMLSNMSAGLGGSMFGNFKQKEITTNTKETSIPKYILTGPDYEYYLKTNAKGVTSYASSTYPYNGEYLKQRSGLRTKIDINEYNFLGCVSIQDYEYMKEYERTGYYGVDQGVYENLRVTDAEYVYIKGDDGRTYDVIRIDEEWRWRIPEDINEMLRLAEANGLKLEFHRTNKPKAYPVEYKSREYIKEKYNMSYEDAIKTSEMIDSIGSCTYAALANCLVSQYKNKPEVFEEVTGIPLYQYDEKGNKYINSLGIMADLYIKINSENITDQENALFRINDKTGKVTIINENEKVGQAYLMAPKSYSENSIDYFINMFTGDYGVNSDLIKKYLEYNGNRANIKVKTYNYNLATSNLKSNISSIQKNMDNGYECAMDIFDNVPLYDISNKKLKDFDINKQKPYLTLKPGDGHEVKITGITEEGFIVSSWGKRMYILYDDLKKDNYLLHAIKIDIE